MTRPDQHREDYHTWADQRPSVSRGLFWIALCAAAGSAVVIAYAASRWV